MYLAWEGYPTNEKEKKSTVNKSGNYTKPGMRKDYLIKSRLQMYKYSCWKWDS